MPNQDGIITGFQISQAIPMIFGITQKPTSWWSCLVKWEGMRQQAADGREAGRNTTMCPVQTQRKLHIPKLKRVRMKPPVTFPAPRQIRANHQRQIHTWWANRWRFYGRADGIKAPSWKSTKRNIRCTIRSGEASTTNGLRRRVYAKRQPINRRDDRATGTPFWSA